MTWDLMLLSGSTLLEINNDASWLVPTDFQENVPVLQLALAVGVTGLTGNGSNNDIPEPGKNITDWACYTWNKRVSLSVLNIL